MTEHLSPPSATCTRGRREELRAFLQSRRARLQPAELGLSTFGRRRVPGLRREELAQAAGVSATYYARLEQGTIGDVSDGILDSVARALRLNDDEQHYLTCLVRAASVPDVTPPPSVRPAVIALLDAMVTVPAYVVGRRTDILAWNVASLRVFGDWSLMPAAHRNWAHLIFRDPASKRLFVDWERKAEDVVGYLRMGSAQHPKDPHLATIVRDLIDTSATFARLWTEHHVREKSHGQRVLNHPEIGDLRMRFETLHLADQPGLSLITHHAEPESQEALNTLLLAPPARQ